MYLVYDINPIWINLPFKLVPELKYLKRSGYSFITVVKRGGRGQGWGREIIMYALQMLITPVIREGVRTKGMRRPCKRSRDGNRKPS